MVHFQILPSTANSGTHNKERLFLEIRNRYKWLLDFGGERVLLYKRRFEGTKSADYDPVRKRSRQNGQDPIASGYGTGYVGGYFEPIEIVVRLVSSSARITQDLGGRKMEFSPRCWTLWEPLLSNGDFIVRRNNERLKIVDVTQHRWKHFVTRQDFDVAEIERNAPEYQIPI